MDRVVVHDPRFQLSPGTLLRDRTAELAVSEGVIALPVITEIIHRGGAAGYSLRSYGDQGHPPPALNPSRFAPITFMHHQEEHADLLWVAVLAPVQEAPQVRGHFRLTSDSSQLGCVNASVHSAPGVDVVDMGRVAGQRNVALDPSGTKHGWVVVGRCTVRADFTGHLGLCLYGSGLGFTVRTLAVSLSPE